MHVLLLHFPPFTMFAMLVPPHTALLVYAVFHSHFLHGVLLLDGYEDVLQADLRCMEEKWTALLGS